MGERVADALSKGNMEEVRAEMPDGIDVSSRASRVLGKWLDDPVVTRSLVRRGLMEVAAKCEVEIGRDYALERDALKRGDSI